MNLDRKITSVVLLFFVGVFCLSPFSTLAITIPSDPTEPPHKNLLASLYQSFTQTALIQTIADAITPFVSAPYVYEPTTTHSSQKQKPTYIPLQQSSQNQKSTTTPTPTPTTNPSPASSISSSPAFYSNTQNYTTTTSQNQNYITRQEFEQRLSQLSSALSSITIPTITTTPSPQPSNNVYQVIAQSSRIDQLSGTSISNPTITGGTITNTSINSSSLNISGSATLSTTSVTDLLVSGNVGVGTTSPAYPLSVVGNGRITGHLAVGSGIYPGWDDSPSSDVTAIISQTYSGGTNYKTGIQAYTYYEPNIANSGLYGADIETMITGTQNSTGYNIAMYTSAGNNSTGTTTDTISIFSNSTPGKSVNNFGFTNRPGLWPGDNVVNNYDIYLDNFYGGGTQIENNYGMYIADHSQFGTKSNYNIYSAGNNSKNYFAGNVGLGTTTPTLGRLVVEPGAYVSAGGVWTNASDRNQKENFTQVSPEETLLKINQLSITQWNYKTEDKSVKHIGPVAQDFYSIFGLGNNDTSISTIDPAGVALLGIQALSKRIDSLFSTSTSTSSPLSLIAMGGKDIIDSLGYYSGQIVDGVIHFARVTVDTLTAKSGVFERIQSGESNTQKLCVGSTCITETELKTILDKNSIATTSVGQVGNSTDSVQTPTETITEPVASSTTSITIDQSQSTTSPDSIIEDYVSSSTTPIGDSIITSSTN